MTFSREFSKIVAYVLSQKSRTNFSRGVEHDIMTFVLLKRWSDTGDLPDPLWVARPAPV